MKSVSTLLFALFCSYAHATQPSDPGPPSAPAPQSNSAPPYQLYGGYSWLSNSLNGTPGSSHPLNGWNAGIAFAQWHHLRFKLDYSMFRGTNLSAPQHPFLILGGGQYDIAFHRERFFAEALVGEAGLNGTWYKGSIAGYKDGNTGGTASLAEFFGGGIDTPIGAHTAFRIEGGVQHTNFNPVGPLPDPAPYHMNGLPNYFGRISAGIVFTPRLGPEIRPATPHAPVESEIIFEGLNSFGHFHIFADTWYSYLSAGGVEYDRHSWGRMLWARRDYTAEILPVLILRQPAKTDVWGDRLSQSYGTVPGVNISPIGMRLLWRDGTRFKPYYVIKCGMSGFTSKAFSKYAAYENFSLQQGVGMQFRLTDRWDFRTGFEVFHSSNGFVVPSNPGLDEMSWNVGLSYHLRGSAVSR
ncbi:MAG: acyloxyacyl hydrolase [Terracidiphilus sp.]